MNFEMKMHRLVIKVSKYENEYVHVYASYDELKATKKREYVITC